MPKIKKKSIKTLRKALKEKSKEFSQEIVPVGPHNWHRGLH